MNSSTPLTTSAWDTLNRKRSQSGRIISTIPIWTRTNGHVALVHPKPRLADQHKAPNDGDASNLDSFLSNVSYRGNDEAQSSARGNTLPDGSDTVTIKVERPEPSLSTSDPSDFPDPRFAPDRLPMATELQRQVDYLEHCTDFNKDMDSSFCNPDDIEVYRRNKCYGGYVDYTIYGPGPSNTFNPSSQGHSQSQAPAMSSQATYQETTAPFQCSSASMIGPACPGQSSNFDPHFCQSLADCSLVPGVPFQTINPREHSLPSTSHPPFRRPSFPTYASTDSTHQHMTRMTVTSRHQSSGRANRGTIIDPSAMIHKPYATKKPQRTFTSHGPGPNF